MKITKITDTFDTTTPIFFDEILKLFEDYSKQYVYKMLKKAEETGEIKSFDRGVYYIPEKSFFGDSTISSDQVAEKKYVKKENEIYGIYCGLGLLNNFGITTQMPNKIEIVTNNETTRRREIQISNRVFVIRKARCEISKENAAAYTILQLFNDMNDSDSIDKSSYTRIMNFISKHKVSKKQLISLADFFPGKTVKRMMRSPLFYGTI